MEPDQNIEDYSFDLSDDEVIDESASVDDFIKELEAKEKDLHITADTTFIEIAADFEDGELPDFLKPDLPDIGPITVAPAVADTPLAGHSTVVNLEKEIAILKDKISAMQAERSGLFESAQRRSKDFDAYKARTERERGETFQKQLSNLATQMLPALDNLDRALKFASDMPEAQRNEFVDFFDGIVLVDEQINEVLMGMGIEPIITVGRLFNPHLHEAVAIDETGEYPANTISEELLRGYHIGDSIIRHSMVKVSQPVRDGDQTKVELADDYGEIVFSDTPYNKPLAEHLSDPIDNNYPQDDVSFDDE